MLYLLYFCGNTGVLKYVGAVSSCLKYMCLDSFLTCKKISAWYEGLGSYKFGSVCSDTND